MLSNLHDLSGHGTYHNIHMYKKWIIIIINQSLADFENFDNIAYPWMFVNSWINYIFFFQIHKVIPGSEWTWAQCPSLYS